MGELILCKRPIAAIPYYLEGASINVYSLEELSYFLYHHTYQIPQDFMSVELCHWIGKELHIPELEQQLLEMLKENVPLHIFVGHLLSGTDYLTFRHSRSTTRSSIRTMSETSPSFLWEISGTIWGRPTRGCFCFPRRRTALRWPTRETAGTTA